MGVLLQQGIGDTVRVSLTPEPGGDRTLRCRSRRNCCRPWACAPSCRWSPPAPDADARRRRRSRNSPGDPRLHPRRCRRGSALPRRRDLNVAVMGCIVNGPGESKHADIGISLPGTGEAPAAPVFIDGKKAATLRGPTMGADFNQMVTDYIERRFGRGGARPRRSESQTVSDRFLWRSIAVRRRRFRSTSTQTIPQGRQDRSPRSPRPTGKYKAVRVSLARGGAKPFCFDTISIFLSVYPDSFAEQRKQDLRSLSARPAPRRPSARPCRKSNGCRIRRCASPPRPI